MTSAHFHHAVGVEDRHSQRSEAIRHSVLVGHDPAAEFVRVHGGDDTNKILEKTCLLLLSDDLNR